LLAKNNRSRTRRASFLLALVLGALFGGLLFRFVGSAIALAVSAGGKFLVSMMYLFNEAEREKDETADEKV
jgi:uncharacterized membrane protein YoaK (UPF0700 family)